MDRMEQARLDIYSVNQQQIVDWPCIGDDNPHDTSKAEADERLDIALYVFDRAELINVVRLKKAIQLVA